MQYVLVSLDKCSSYSQPGEIAGPNSNWTIVTVCLLFPNASDFSFKKTSEQCLDPNTGGKLKCQIRGMAVHRISKEIQG